MSTSDVLPLIACAGQLALAGVAATRVGRSPLALPLALLSVDLFAWNFAALAFDLSGHVGWHLLDDSASPLGVPLFLHFVIVFVGRRRSLGPLLCATYAVFGALSGCTLLAGVVPGLAAFVNSSAWPAVFLVALVPAVAVAVGLLLRHLWTTSSLEEKERTRLLVAALVVGTAFGSTELLTGLGVGVPRLGAIGTLLSSLLLAVVALRLRLLENNLSALSLANAVAIGAVAVVGYVTVFEWVGGNIALLVVGTMTVTLAAAVALRQASINSQAHHERTHRLAILGRLSGQMAHDLKNPLAALKGAAQFLQEERKQGRSLADHPDFLDLIVEQTDRVQRVIDDYQRLGRADPVLAPLRLNEVVESVLGLQAFTSRANVEVKKDLASGLPELSADRDLVAAALENLVKNAFEAMPERGTVTVRTEPVDGVGTMGIALSVTDTGAGMDARTRERAFDDFFTTKSAGSGFGLAFVRRVAEAHGGEASLTSEVGQGTVVRIVFPAANAKSHSSNGRVG